MATAKAKENEHEKRTQEYYNEKVPVFIPRPENEPEDSVTITVNGKNYQILYDREVMVPRFVALVVEESKANKRKADEEMRKRAGSKSLGEYN